MKFSTFNSTWNLFLDFAIEAAETQDNFVGFFDNPRDFRDSNEYYGRGCFSSVYGSIHPDYVIKEGSKLTEDGWLYYALDCLALGDQRKVWMPEVKLIVIDEKRDRFHAIIERLESCCNTLRPWFQNDLGDMYLIEYEIKESQKISSQYKEEILEYLNAFGSEFGRKRDEVRLDAHEENWLLRPSDSNIVLTDPFSHGIPWDWTKRFARACEKRFPNQIKFISA